MRIKEEYIVPGLGAIILLSVFGFAAGGASPIYPVLLGILGLAAVGTYFLPAAVQVEVRIAIAVLGLMILVIYFSSVSFWLALLAFGAIGASQIRHGAMLSMPPKHTVAYVKTLLDKRGAAGTAGADAAGGDGSGDAPPKTDASGETNAAASAAALQGLGALQRMLRVNVGGIGGSVLAAFILLSIFTMPYVALVASVEYGGESESEAEGFTFREVSQEIDEELDDGIPGILFIVLAAVAAVSHGIGDSAPVGGHSCRHCRDGGDAALVHLHLRRVQRRLRKSRLWLQRQHTYDSPHRLVRGGRVLHGDDRAAAHPPLEQVQGLDARPAAETRAHSPQCDIPAGRVREDAYAGHQQREWSENDQ